MATPTTDTTDSAPHGSPAGAMWTAGLGAFLLFAAAATFITIRWDDIPDGAKLGALLAVTGICLAAHQRLRPTLPITASALFHLGVLLVPIDVAAVGVRAGWEWPQMLFAQGLSATVVFGVASAQGPAHERSVVLRFATWAGVVVLAAGVGGVTTVPAGVVLSCVALAAAGLVEPQRSKLRLDLGAGAWAVLAGFATPLAAASTAELPFAGTLTQLGLVGGPRPAAAATGLLSGLALGVLGARRRSVALVLAGVAAGLVGLTATWVRFEPDDASSLAAVAFLCLATQVVHRAYARDPFWRGPAGVVAEIGMAVTALLTIGFSVVLFWGSVTDVDPSPVAGMAAVAVTATWLLAATSLVSAQSLSAAVVGAAAAALLFTGRPEAAAVSLGLLGAAAVLVAPRFSRAASADQLFAVALVAAAPLAAWEMLPLSAALAAVGALAIAEAAVHASRRPTPAPVAPPPVPVPGPWVAPGFGARAAAVRAAKESARAFELAMLGLVPVSAGAAMLAREERWAAMSLGLVVIGWVMALVLDRATQGPGEETLATIPRVGMVVALVTTVWLSPLGAAGVAALVMGLLLADTLRLDEPAGLIGVGCAGPIVAAGLAVDVGWTLPEAGIVVTVTSLVWLGLAGSLPGRWAPPALVSAVVAGGAGLCLGTGDGVAFSTVLLLLGAGVAAVGLVTDQLDVGVLGGTAMTIGTWGLLSSADVTAADAYVAPVAVLLLAVGLQTRRRFDTTSWLTLAPPVVLLGGAALVERVDGGPSGHAALAGIVGVLAVAAGGAWRLAGPLFAGTALVVAVTVHETLGVTAGLPTWAWLAAGGVTLLAAGVAMERRGVGPVESGRRLVEVIDERFT
ncbi:MAG TPA: hypothetical protein VK611_22275 [Acidimicrobiales bacterium]|nr:hypothetical protein [Acidimicrobiales bacterium]